MSNEEQDEYAKISAEIGGVSVEVEGNHTLEEVKEAFEKSLEDVCSRSKAAFEPNKGGGFR